MLEVNGTSLVGVTHKYAVETLRQAPHVCKLVIERGRAPARQTTGTPARQVAGVTPAVGGSDSDVKARRAGEIASSADKQQVTDIMDVDYPFVNRGGCPTSSFVWRF